FLRAPAIKRSIIASPTVVDPNITAHRPSALLQSLEEPRDAGLPLLIVSGQVHERTDAAHSLARLGVRRDRPRRYRAAERDNEFSPSDVGCHATLPWGSCPCNGRDDITLYRGTNNAFAVRKS